MCIRVFFFLIKFMGATLIKVCRFQVVRFNNMSCVCCISVYSLMCNSSRTQPGLERDRWTEAAAPRRGTSVLNTGRLGFLLYRLLVGLRPSRRAGSSQGQSQSPGNGIHPCVKPCLQKLVQVTAAICYYWLSCQNAHIRGERTKTFSVRGPSKSIAFKLPQYARWPTNHLHSAHV